MHAAGGLLVLLSYHRRCGNAVYALRKDLSLVKTRCGRSRRCARLSVKYPSVLESAIVITNDRGRLC